MASFNLREKLRPMGRDNGFRMEDYWIWDGSIIEGEDGRWHMFASRWPKKYPMHPGWLFLSEIVRAGADTPEGPYSFEEVVLERRDPCYFDGQMTHNPSVRRCGDRYLLFYIGVSYGVPFPEDPEAVPREGVGGTDRWCREVWLRKRIGMAWSRSVFGPWHRSDEPVLKPRPGKWDRGTTSNPSPCVMEDGSIYLAYKSGFCPEGTRLQPFRIGLARAAAWDAPFERVSDAPILQPGNPGTFLEDPFLWHADGRFHIMMKELQGYESGHKGYGLYASSPDGTHWQWGDPIIAYTRELPFAGGRKEVGQVERPQLVFRNGKATHFTAASAYSAGDLQEVTDSWVSVIPLRN